MILFVCNFCIQSWLSNQFFMINAPSTKKTPEMKGLIGGLWTIENEGDQMGR